MSGLDSIRSCGLKILVIEGQEQDFTDLQKFILNNAKLFSDIHWVRNLQEGVGWLYQYAADLVLIGFGISGQDKKEAFIAINSRFPLVPVVLLIRNDEGSIAFDSLTIGAQDFLVEGQYDGSTFQHVLESSIGRKKAETKLREMLRRYELAVRGSSHGLWDWCIHPERWDHPDSMIWYSPQVLNVIADRSVGDVLPERYMHFEDWKAQLHPLDRDRVLEAIESHFTKKTPYDVQCRIRVKEGGYRWFQIRGEAMWDENGKPVRMAGSSVDITIRKQEEHGLLIAEEKYRKVFDNSAVAITVTDEQERIVSWNKFTENLLGMSHDDLYLKKIESFYPEEEWKKIRSYNIREKGMQHHLETRMRTKNGHLIDIDVSISVLKDPDGQITGSIGISRDITERKQSEIILKKLSSVVEQTGDSVIITDVNGVIEYVNPAFEQNTGYKKEEVIGQTPRILKSGKHEPEFYQELWNTILSGQVFRATFTNKKKNGILTYEEQVITPLKGNQGNVTHFVSTARDITFRKEAEEALKKAKDEAEAANRAKSEFLANMSHEIRTPMNGVLGMIGLIMDTELTPEQREYAEGVRNSAETLLTLINDILDFSKIEAGRLTIEPISFDLQVSVEEVADMVALKAIEKGIELIVRFDPDGPTRVIGDAGRIRQVLVNLVSNAVKFTEKGHVLINVECRKKDEHQAEYYFSVEDSGIGISKDNLEKIFDKFTQADPSTTRRYGGTGLGLAISKQLVQMMGGDIGAESELNKGSSFWFTMRLPIDLEAPPEIPTADLRGLKALIVDDHEINRKVLVEQVSSWGVEVQAFATAAEALAALQIAYDQKKPYQIAILDYNLPGMNGEMLAHAIKSAPNLNETILVLLTSIGTRGDGKRLSEAGFAAYLVKPVRQNQLKEVMSIVWGSKKNGTPVKLITRHTLKENKGARLKSVEEKPLGEHLGRVLLAEDNIVNQQVARRMLEKMGCRVDVVANGKEAVRMVEKFPYDLVFMDCQMPEMDGYEATRQIRVSSVGAHLPIVAITAHAMEGEKEKCFDAGMDDYLCKPVKKEDLIAVLEKWIKNDKTKSVSQDKHEDNRVETKVSEPRKEDSVSQIPAINEERLKSLMEFTGDDDPNFIMDLFETYFTSAGQRLAAMKDAIERKDADLLRREGHSLKGSSVNLGIQVMADLSKQLETIGKTGTVDGAQSIYDQLEIEIKRVRDEFDNKIKVKK